MPQEEKNVTYLKRKVAILSAPADGRFVVLFYVNTSNRVKWKYSLKRIDLQGSYICLENNFFCAIIYFFFCLSHVPQVKHLGPSSFTSYQYLLPAMLEWTLDPGQAVCYHNIAVYMLILSGNTPWAE